MNARRQSHTDQVSALATGWLVSCLLHGALALAALLFLQRLQLAPQPKSFQWDVAMVGTMAPSTGAPSLQPTTSSAPPIQEAIPSQTVTRSRSAQPSPSNAPSPQMATPMYEETHLPSSPPHTDQIPQQQEPTASTVHDSALPSSTIPPSAVAVEATTEPASVSEPLASAQDGSALSQNQFSPTRVDYGWLADLMAKWSQDLDRHYPATLRTEGVQGKVILSALLHDTGVLSDIRVTKSSGNAQLDQAAVDDVKNGPSIKLPRPLERPSMRVKIPIVYILNDMR